MAFMSGKKFIEEYGDQEVVFSHYFKYVFNFSGETDKIKFMLSIGGDSDEIYRLEVSNNVPVLLSSFDIDEIQDIYVTEK